MPLITLPVQFISFTGRLLPNKTVRLDWEAATDQQHDYFDVERSTDGSNFVSIGKGPSSVPYWKVDLLPAIGNNYYRIKQLDKDGKFTYSATVNVVYSPSAFFVSIYPNPVEEVLNVKLNSLPTDRYRIAITDVTGRRIHEEIIVNNNNSGQELNIDFRDKAAGLYVLTMHNSKNEIVTWQKIVKQ